MNESRLAEIQNWIADDPDPKTAAQIKTALDSGDEASLNKWFNGFLQFGTAGLRGPIAPGPSSMNLAVVGRTASGIANYMKSHNMKSVVIGRDARHGSEEFTKISAEIFSGAGMNVFVLPRPLPTPVLAWAVNSLKADVGIMVTASHNPPMDNGYKVYIGTVADGINYRGSQIINPTDELIAKEIAAINSLKDQPRGANWTVLDDAIFNEYIERTAKLVNNPGKLKVVYTAMHGVGKETIEAVFKKSGFAAPIMVTEQVEPDPDFPTVAFPNPEEPGAIDLSLTKAKEVGADLVIANDPDADRCAAAINDPVRGWRMLTGDELGIVFGEYIGRSKKSGIFANSIVSSSCLKKIAEHYGINFYETLTGFKWIAKIENLTFGYEEAIGYGVDLKTANDKDGISAALYLTQIATDLAKEGRTIADLLNEVWQRHGFHGTEQISIRVSDMSRVGQLLNEIRKNPPTEIAGKKVISIDDLAKPKDGLPPTDGLRIWLAGARLIIRPSGTEPKLKCYVEVITSDINSGRETLDELREPLRKFLS